MLSIQQAETVLDAPVRNFSCGRLPVREKKDKIDDVAPKVVRKIKS
jgi:hypothetical protein